MQKILLILLILLGVTTTTKAEMKNRKKTSLIIIHHSDTEMGNVKIFRRFHKEEKKWDDIGYHFVITNGKGGPDGEVQRGREMKKQGAHAKNRNYNSVGICLVGNDDFTEKQREAAIWLIMGICLKYQIDPSEKTIQPHHEKCPGSGVNLSEVIEEVKKRIKLFVQ